VSAEADVLRHRDVELMRLLWRQGSASRGRDRSTPVSQRV
jgi:hypothetical protein